MQELLGTGHAAEIVGISRQAFHKCYIATGKINPVAKTTHGHLLFNPRDVRNLAKARWKGLKKKK